MPKNQLYGDCIACGKVNVNNYRSHAGYKGAMGGHFCICQDCSKKCHVEKKSPLDLRKENGLPPPTLDQLNRGAPAP